MKESTHLRLGLIAKRAAQQRHLVIDTYLGIHTGPKSWQDVVQISTGSAALH